MPISDAPSPLCILPKAAIEYTLDRWAIGALMDMGVSYSIEKVGSLMETTVHAKEGDRIQISVQVVEQDTSVFAFCLDSKQHQLAESWQPGNSVITMPIDRAVLLTRDKLDAVFNVPHEDDWLVVIDAHPEQQPSVCLLAGQPDSNNALHPTPTAAA